MHEKFSNSSVSGLMKIRIPAGYSANDMVGVVYQELFAHGIRTLYCAVESEEKTGRLFYLTESPVSHIKLAGLYPSEIFEIQLLKPMRRELKDEFVKMIHTEDYLDHEPGIVTLIGPTFLGAIRELKETASDLKDNFWRKKPTIENALIKIEGLCMGYAKKKKMDESEPCEVLHRIADEIAENSSLKRKQPLLTKPEKKIKTSTPITQKPDLIPSSNPDPFKINTSVASLIGRENPVPSKIFNFFPRNVQSHVLQPLPCESSTFSLISTPARREPQNSDQNHSPARRPSNSEPSSPISITASKTAPTQVANLVPSKLMSPTASPMSLEKLIGFRFSPRPEVNQPTPNDPRNSPTPEKPIAVPSPVEENQAVTQKKEEVKSIKGILKHPKTIFTKYPNTRSRSKD